MAINTKEFFNRDLSWLRFNHRVLQEASDIRNPLYERLKFLAIFSSNLDEFFKVRVSDIRKIKELDKPLRKKLITKPNKLLSKIKSQVNKQQEEFGAIFFNEILPELAKHNIHLLKIEDLDSQQISFIIAYYESIKHQFKIIKNEDFKTLENEVLYLVGSSTKGDLIGLKIIEDISRFVEIPNKKGENNFIFIDDVLRFALKENFESEFYALKISRDAGLYIDSEYSGDLLEKIKNALPNRETGQVTRALIDQLMPNDLISKLEKTLDINETDLVKGGRYHNFKDLFAFPEVENDVLYFKNLPPIKNERFTNKSSVFEVIEQKDQLLSFPYESFNDVITLLETAATDKTVTKIKITLYRVATDSSVSKAILKAIKNGKEVFVFIETKARFDEQNNIKWGKLLQDNGANVKYSYAGIKVHSKIFYIEKIENDTLKSYAYIGSGNFNEKTSKIYTDFGLMTANPKITSEIAQVFQVLEGNLIIPKTKHLLVSPFTTRSTFTKLVENEIENSKSGKEAYIVLKLNSLQDDKMIQLLYKANNAGVKIRLLVRGICCLVPGIKNQSEHIFVTSIVDRFLEHSRVYIFANGGQEKLYFGSADWMTRNLDYRIEVITPILDATIFQQIKNQLEIQLNDNAKARIIDHLQTNTYINTTIKASESSQHIIYRSLL
ncbi:polyphosphate kinase 1 [Cellulophaga baltica]|uniref:polyphosphate kinase 1 n=1 Tax=Cellulophaga TaxID=104264 RepID=UPI001C06E7A7|nr:MULTISPECIES: polyphosphate kinase 1 [Cellulophaga]MBU2997269.1 polyphosphate kinase 1 [Cellulophaga baltica]MDO6768667.1 polyphosphate kinase 1 [Cellulophaga sp. 1_MG-2023]